MIDSEVKYYMIEFFEHTFSRQLPLVKIPVFYSLKSAGLIIH